MHDDNQSAQERTLVSMRTMDIAVAVLFLIGSGIVIYNSARLGFGWLEGEGPAPGYFPFYIGLILAVASIVNLVRAVLRIESGGEGIFVTAPAFGRVLTVLVPTLIFVALIGGLSFGFSVTIPQGVVSILGLSQPVEIPVGIPRLGIYMASAIFMFGFMLAIGRETPLKATLVALAVPIILYVMFEKEFLTLLPKCQIGLCEGLEERLIGTPYDAAKDFLLRLLRVRRPLSA